MMRTGKCTKCGNSVIGRVSGKLGPLGGRNTIPVGYWKKEIGVTRHVCFTCGYSEDSVLESQDLEVLRENYVDDAAQQAASADRPEAGR